MKQMSAGEVITSVVFGGMGCFLLVAAFGQGRGWAESGLLAVCALGAVAAAFRFQIAALVAWARR